MEQKKRNQYDNLDQEVVFKYLDFTRQNVLEDMEADVFLRVCKKAAAIDLNIASRKMEKKSLHNVHE